MAQQNAFHMEMSIIIVQDRRWERNVSVYSNASQWYDAVKSSRRCRILLPEIITEKEMCKYTSRSLNSTGMTSTWTHQVSPPGIIANKATIQGLLAVHYDQIDKNVFDITTGYRH